MPAPTRARSLPPARVGDRRQLCAVFLATTSSVPAARAWVCKQLTDQGHEGAAQVVALLVSELTTNAVRHATTTQFRVCLHLTGHGVEVAVHDDDPATTPGIRQAGDRDEDGRGLAVVAALSHDWGIGVTDAEKWVWFHLRNPAT